jgi:hypothetical protein
MTRRWRKPDSNSQSHPRERVSFGDKSTQIPKAMSWQTAGQPDFPRSAPYCWAECEFLCVTRNQQNRKPDQKEMPQRPRRQLTRGK